MSKERDLNQKNKAWKRWAQLLPHFKLTPRTQQRRNCESCFVPLAGSWGACGPEEGLCRRYKRLHVGITISQQIRLLGAKFNVYLQFRPMDGRLPGPQLLRPLPTPARTCSSSCTLGGGKAEAAGSVLSQTRPARSCPEHSTASSPNAAKRLLGELPGSFHNEEQLGNKRLLVGDLI